MIRVFSGFLIALAMALPAQAEPYVKLSAEQIRATFLGAHLIGETARSGLPWQTCVSAEGDVRNEFEGKQEAGNLVVTEDARACFVKPSGPRCYDVFRSGETYLLTGTSEFKVNQVVRGVESCEAAAS